MPLPSSRSFDLVVVGGGPGGYVAAIRAAQLGMKVALVERMHLGGICLNWGCIPTKALLRSSELAYTLRHAGDLGFDIKDFSFDIQKMVKRSRDVADQLTKGVRHLLKKNRVTVVDGHGKLAGKGTLEVEKDGKTERITAPHIILSTGARPRVLPGLEPDGERVWSSREAMIPEEMPGSVLVVGSGAIGIEFASFYRNLGAEVTIVEIAERILPVEDGEISALARKAFEKQGMVIHTGAKVEKLDRKPDRVVAHVAVSGKTQKIETEAVIVAVGIVGNIEELGLETLGVKTDRGHIVVDGYARTSAEGVYAIGDVAGPPWLAHKASHEGIICVETIAGTRGVHPLETGNIPGCTYSMPQIASVGLTEAKAREQGHTVKVGRFPYVGNGKAIAMGEAEGLVKTVFDAKTGELLGAHMIGAEVTELIQGYTIARTLETTEAELMHTIFPHPTLSEMMHESVLDAYGRAVHT